MTTNHAITVEELEFDEVITLSNHPAKRPQAVVDASVKAHLELFQSEFSGPMRAAIAELARLYK